MIRILALQNTLEIRLFWSVCVLVCAAGALYLYAVTATVFHIATSAHVEERARNERARIGALEVSYLAAQKDLSIELAYDLGFVDAPEARYLSVAKGSGLTLNSGE